MATPVPVDHYGPGGDGDREKSPSGGTVNLAKSAVSAVGGAVRTVGGYLFRSDEAAAGDKPREVRTDSDAEWDMADLVRDKYG